MSSAIRQELNSPLSEPWFGEAFQALTQAGLSIEDATKLLLHGLDAHTAIDLLSLKLISPKPQKYGQALATMTLLQVARGKGSLSA